MFGRPTYYTRAHYAHDTKQHQKRQPSQVSPSLSITNSKLVHVDSSFSPSIVYIVAIDSLPATDLLATLKGQTIGILSVTTRTFTSSRRQQRVNVHTHILISKLYVPSHTAAAVLMSSQSSSHLVAMHTPQTASKRSLFLCLATSSRR